MGRGCRSRFRAGKEDGKVRGGAPERDGGKKDEGGSAKIHRACAVCWALCLVC